MAGPRPSIWDDGCPPPQAAYPGTRTGRPRASPYLALLRVGFTEPVRSPGLLVRSYRTVSPLPRLSGAVCFLWHFPEGHPWWTLSTTLPCGARTFLPQTIAARGRAARSGRYFIRQRHRLHNRRPASDVRACASSTHLAVDGAIGGGVGRRVFAAAHMAHLDRAEFPRRHLRPLIQGLERLVPDPVLTAPLANH